MNRAYYLLTVFFVLITFSLTAQKHKTQEHKVKGAVGVAVAGPTVPPIEVKKMALSKAKEDALKKAGIAEQINSFSDYFRSESENKMDELFTSDVISNIRGNVKNIEEVSANQEITAEGQTKYTVVINCVVVEYKTDKDLTFEVEVDSVKGLYKAGDPLAFKVTPMKDCYIRAFMFSPAEAYLLLPNDYEPSKLLTKGKTQRFPSFNGDYELDSGGKEKELNRLILVFLKQDIPYVGEVKYKEIIEWIMTIPPDERLIKTFSFDVYNMD